MDPLKMGRLIKALRKEKNLTQEQLAEAFFVSGKTVSRWETGSTLPDLLTLQNIADYFGVDIRELIDGERFPAERKDDALPEEKETVKKMSEYSDSKEKRSIRKMWWVFLLILLAIAAAATFLVLKKRNEDLDRVQSRTVIGEATHYEPDGDGGLEIFLLCNETSISRIRVTPETRVPEGLLARLQAGEKGLFLQAETVYTERDIRQALKNGTAAVYRATDLYSAGIQPGYISSEDRVLRPLLPLREGYTVLQAERDGCVVADGYALLHGEMLLEEFLLRCGQGIPGTIRVYQRYSNSGNSPDYFLKELAFTGSEYILSFYDRTGDTDEWFLYTRSFGYLKDEIETHYDRRTRHIFLADNPSATFEAYMKRFLSSTLPFPDDGLGNINPLLSFSITVPETPGTTLTGSGFADVDGDGTVEQVNLAYNAYSGIGSIWVLSAWSMKDGLKYTRTLNTREMGLTNLSLMEKNETTAHEDGSFSVKSGLLVKGTRPESAAPVYYRIVVRDGQLVLEETDQTP